MAGGAGGVGETCALERMFRVEHRRGSYAVSGSIHTGLDHAISPSVWKTRR